MRKLSVWTFAALLFGQFATSWADPPAGRGNGVGVSRSTLQRAADSRAGLQQRANARAQGSVNAGAGVGVGGSGVGGTAVSGSAVGQNSANANGNVGVSADIQADANGSANAQSGTGRLPREVVVRRLQSLRSQQSAVVRTATRTGVGIGIGNDSPSDTRTQSDKNPQPNNRPPRGKSGAGSNPDSNSNENSESSNRSGLLSLNGSARSEVVAHGQNRMALTNADKLLAQRLARIDQMRDQALESGNDQKLDQADRLELDARTQFAERLAAGANDSSSQTGANAQGQATGAIRGRINRTTPQNPNPEVPTDGSNNPDSDTNAGLLSGEAAAGTQNEATAALSNRARRNTERTRRDTNPAESTGKIRGASFRSQANSTNAAEAAAGNNSLNAAGTSATNAAASAQSK